MDVRQKAFDPRADVSFVVVSCDAYRDLWDPFFGCMEKYWPDCPFKRHLITNELAYERNGVSVIQIGPDTDYASNLIRAVSAVPTEWLILWVEDAIFTKSVDTQRITSLVTEAERLGAGFLKLTPDAPLSFEDQSGERIGTIPPGVRYRSAIGAALYRKDVLLRLLVPGYSAWELDKSGGSDQFPEPFMALTVREAKNPPMPAINAVIKGQWYLPVIPFLRREGYAAVLPGRKPQSIWGFLYIHLYLCRIALYRFAKRHWYER